MAMRALAAFTFTDNTSIELSKEPKSDLKRLGFRFDPYSWTGPSITIDLYAVIFSLIEIYL